MRGLGESIEWLNKAEQASKDKGCYREMMLNYIEVQVDRKTNDARKFMDKDKWLNKRLIIKRELLKSLGLEPLPPRTPLYPRITGIIDGDGYLIRKLIFEPRPWFLVPAHLYIPKLTKLPAPAILYSVGHWMVYGKMELDIHLACTTLAKLGFIVLVYDPIGQGERGCSFEDHGNKDLILLGLSQAGLMVWESMRAIDYLLTCPEVDGNRIGMTGASGGGLNTLYTCAVDERIAVSIPVCYVTSFSYFLRAMRGLNWNGGIDLCNQVPNIIEYSDMAGVCSLIFPRPLMLIGATFDQQFPIEGTRETFEQIQSIYEWFGVKNRVAMAAVESGHGYDQAMRKIAYQWFYNWLMEAKFEENAAVEPEIPDGIAENIEFKSFLWNTTISSGPVIKRLSKEVAKNLPPGIELPHTKGDLVFFQEELKQRLFSAFRLTVPSEKSEIVEQEQHFLDKDKVIVEKTTLKVENEIYIPFCSWKPNNIEKSISKFSIIFLSDKGKLAGIDIDTLELMLRKGMSVFSLDVRGTGETTPFAPEYQTLATVCGTLEKIKSNPGDTLEFEVSTNCLMLGRSLVSQQVFDVLAFLSYLETLSNVESHLTKNVIVANGIRSSLIALVAAAIDDRIKILVVNEFLVDYQSTIGLDKTVLPIGIYVFGILKYLDIPQIATLIAPRLFILNRGMDARGIELNTKEIREKYDCVNKVYKLMGQDEKFNIVRLPIREVIAQVVDLVSS